MFNPIFQQGQFQNNNNPNSFFNHGGNDSWKGDYNLSNNQNQNNFQSNPYQNQDNKMNIVFRTSNGKTFNILFSPERTVEDLILTFFKRVDQEELFTKGGVAFVHNALQFSYHTKDKVRNFFRYNQTPTIMVLDVNNLIGAGI